MLSPALFLLLGALNDGLGADPIEYILHTFGDWALRFLLLTLAMTPLRQVSGNTVCLRFRRMIGLFAFFYASMHFLVWFVLDQSMIVELIIEDIVKRPYITVGFTAWLLLIPLAVTSTKSMIRRLGKRWKKLHQLIYLIVLLAILHFVWLVKADLLEPVIYFLLYLSLMFYRYYYAKKLKAS
jgi:sulfoxide reductase heme-binding subunit YedZ